MKYDKEYWDKKWAQAPIIYNGRVLRVGKETVAVDVRNFITANDSMLDEVVKKYRLNRGSMNERAHAVQKFVVKFLTYKYDSESQDCPEFWQFPFETLHSKIGDCEDGAILIASLCRAAGIPEWRIKVAAGYVQSAPTAPQGGHGYAVYLADRPDTSRGLEWVVLDWCYYEDSKYTCEQKALAKNGGYKKCYKETWFTFNDEASWNQKSLKISNGRIAAAEKGVEEVNLLEEVMLSVAEKMSE